MDELEFRRRIFTDPQDNCPAMQETKKTHPEREELADELATLDEQLAEAFSVDVPEGLAQRILANTAKEAEDDPNESKKRSRHFFAIAASIIFTSGLTLGAVFSFFALEPSIEIAQTQSLNSAALAHSLSESSFIEASDQQVTLQQVNLKLRPLGAALKNPLPGDVTFTNYCLLNGLRTLHLSLKVEDGQHLDIYMVPQQSDKMETQTAGDMQSVSIPVDQLSILVVGDKLQPLQEVAELVSRNLNQSI